MGRETNNKFDPRAGRRSHAPLSSSRSGTPPRPCRHGSRPCPPPGGVASGEERGDRHGALARRAEDQPIARAQVLARQLEPPELVLLEGVRPGDVGDEIGAVALEDARHPVSERGQVDLAVRPPVQPDVLVARRLHERIVVLFVDREREDRGVVPEDGGRAVPLVDIHVDHGRPLDRSIVEEITYRDGDVVQDAEPFAVIRERVMEAAREVDGRPALDGQPGRENASSRAENEASTRFLE